MVDEKDSPEIYSLRDSSALPETVITPLENGDIFAIKKENISQLDSLFGMALSGGIFLCQAYRLDKLLSRDEMGETWQASDLRESRNVVIYFPPPEMRKEEAAIESIRQNAKHVEALEHPRIVPLVESLTDPEHGFFTVRKFVNGKTLDLYRTEYVKRHGKFAPIKVLKILNDIAHALDYAHSVDIVHGDLCLKSIIVGLDDEVYLDNFAFLPVQAATASAERKPYLAPEVSGGHSIGEDQDRIEGYAATAYSDVYALAIIAYNLLSGRLPFSPDTIDDMPLPIPGVPSTADAVIRQAMAKEPDDRYDSCGAFVKALEASFLKSKRIKSVAVTPSPKRLQRKTIAFRPLLFFGALFGLCLLVGAGVWIANDNSESAKNIRSLFLQDTQNGNNGTIPGEERDNEPQDAEPKDAGVQAVAELAHAPLEPEGVPGIVPPETFNEQRTDNDLPVELEENGRQTSPIETPETEGISESSQDPPNGNGQNGNDRNGNNHLPPVLFPLDNSPVEPEGLQSHPSTVIPANAGIQTEDFDPVPLAPRLHGDDEKNDDAVLPAQMPENLPTLDVGVGMEEQEPQQDNVVPSFESEWLLPISTLTTSTPPISSTTATREEGVTTDIAIGARVYRFLWCQPQGADGFWIQETLIEHETWEDIMGHWRLHLQPVHGARLPVVRVSWDDCQRFIESLAPILANEQFAGYRFSLPTAAQWEHAFGLGILRFPREILEWCNDVNEMGDRAIRSHSLPRSDSRNWRIPIEHGYENVGFRLVIIP